MSSSTSRFEELTDEQTQTPPPAYAATASPAAVPAEEEPAESDDGDEDEDQFEDSVWWTPSELKDIIDRAQELKKKGNAEFGQGRWEMALETYKEGLAELPVRTTPHSAKGKEKALPQEEGTSSDGVADEEEEQDEQEKDMAELSELRSMLSANVAACLLKLERFKDAVKACDEALEENPDYTKALHRRAMANESIGSWSSLSSSLEDFNKLSTLSDISPLLAQQIKQAKQRIPKKIEVQQQKEKDEVLGKLKDLGNTVLGKFGLSTNNFVFQEQPGGGYSMNFQR
ncbi:hypothetical protein JCM6882_004446 [Rhodosporidiobolus microsporus]